MMEPMMKGMLAQADKDMPAGARAQPVPESTSLVTAFTMLLRPADFFRMEVMRNFGRSLLPDADSAKSDLRGLALGEMQGQLALRVRM